eukprot:Nitzschia sp. Nitz4//scaffold19_size178191//93503//94759//NITZ4_001981-RA/size178191-processed-gene-0.63-mRNA-1//-1//CDS//3329540693//4155//frame0
MDPDQQQPLDASVIGKGLGDIQEDEVNKEGGEEELKSSAGGSAPARHSSNGSVSSGGSGSKTKRRTWKKPKDKPKRPLSAYNIFFKHERSRIVEGKTEPASAEETIRSIENILSTSRETRRHRKTHGRISFGDLARKIAEKWKSIEPEQKAVFEHYAELDMRRYRKEVKLWKEKKESEAFSQQAGVDGSINNSMSNSFSSVESEPDYGMDPYSAGGNSDDAWGPRRNLYDSMNSSFSSTCSIESEGSLEPIPIGDMLRSARPNMHASMPNLGVDISVPTYVSGNDSTHLPGGNFMDQQLQYGQQSLSNMQYNRNMDNRGPPLFVSSTNNGSNPMELQQLREQNTFQQLQLQRQQELLMRQHELLQRQLQQTSQMMGPSGSGGGFQFPGLNDPMSMNQQGNGDMGVNHELENGLSNLDI